MGSETNPAVTAAAIQVAFLNSTNGDKNRLNDGTYTSYWTGQMRGFNYFKHIALTLRRWREIIEEEEKYDKILPLECIDMALYNVGLIDDYIRTTDSLAAWKAYDGYTVTEAPSNWAEIMSSYETAILASWGFENVKRIGIERSTKLEINEETMSPLEIMV